MQAWQFSAISESEDRESCKQFYTEVFGGFLSVITIGAAGLILLSPWLTSLLLNKTYWQAAFYMPTLICASALSAVVSFLASVYMVTKRSMNSFATAIAGAVLNIVLNLILIPDMGAIGAAVATVASYSLVFLLRMIDIPRLLKFKFYLPRMLTSMALIAVICIMMMLRPTGWWNPTSFVCTAAVVALNAPPLWKSLKNSLLYRRGNLK